MDRDYEERRTDRIVRKITMINWGVVVITITLVGVWLATEVVA